MSTRITEYPSDKLVDGKVLTGHISHGACTATLDEKVVAMWIVDLKKPRRIERINVFSRTDNLTWDKSNDFTKKLLGFSIIVSNTTDRRDGVVCYQDTQYTASTIPDKVEIFCSVIGRFVFYYNERLPGIRYPKDYSKYAYGDLCEIEVSGCPVAEFGYENADCNIPCLAMCHKYLENLSYRKPTWQSFTYAEFGSSDKAVDGRKSRHYRDGQCTITSQSASNTWWVNLEKKYRIAFITLYLRTDNSTFYFRSIFAKYYLGFAVYVSNTTNRNDGVLCYKDRSYSTRTLPDRVTIRCLQTAQYVIYYNERRRGVVYDSDYSHNVFGDLCEVEVYGCPSPVAEVPECSKPCPSNCETCYPNTGFCTKCKPGFEGSACDVVCDAIGRAGIANDGFYNASFTDMFTSEGHTFLPTEHGFARLILTLSGKSSNVAKLSFTIHKASNVFVAFVNSTNEYTVMHFDQYTKTQHWEVNVINEFMSKVHLIRITVQFKIPFTISNLRLPLRACFRNDSDISEMAWRRPGMFKYVREIH
nr:uncharacterized protein LOC117687041 [Crassostrea gigas]